MARRAPVTVGLATIALLGLALGLALSRGERAWRAAPGAAGVHAKSPAGARAASSELPAEEQTPEQPDLEARVPVAIRVLDLSGKPVPGAQVSIRSLRSAKHPTRFQSYRGEKPSALTDASGRALLACWEWADAESRTLRIDLSVEHPDFRPFRDSTFPLAREERSVVLRRGTVVLLAARLGPDGDPAHELEIRVDEQAQLTPQSWFRQQDGRWLTERLDAGPHLVWVEHYSAVHGRCFSEILAFELADGERKELSVVLHPAERLAGTLDPRVPRPVEEGSVRLWLHRAGSSAGAPSIQRSFDVPIAPDGSFRFTDLPRGEGRTFALCRGWTTQPRTSESGARELQAVRIPHDASPLVLAMERCAALELELRRADSSAVAGAIVTLRPMLFPPASEPALVPWRAWRFESDASGIASVTDLPSVGQLTVLVQHPELALSAEDSARDLAAMLRPGEPVRLRLVLHAQRP